MEEEDDDFTFPTVVADAARAPEGQPGRGGDGPVATAHLLRLLPVLPDLAAPAPSPLWPFAGSSAASVPSNKTAVTEDEHAGRAEERRVEEGEERRAAADEERMDLLWDWAEGGSAAATAAPAASEPDKSRGGGGGQARHAEPPKQQRRAQAEDQHDDDDKQRAAAVADAERMDKLWESFNNEDPAADRWFLCDYRSPTSTDGAESEEGTTCASSPAARRRGYYGCAPAMLRASSRAGGAGQFCPRGQRRRGAAAGWALLLRLFRRLFAVDKTSRSPRGGIYVP